MDIYYLCLRPQNLNPVLEVSNYPAGHLYLHPVNKINLYYLDRNESNNSWRRYRLINMVYIT